MWHKTLYKQKFCISMMCQKSCMKDKALPPARKTEILSWMFRLWSSSSCNLDRQGQQRTQKAMFFKYWYPYTIPHHIKILRTTISALWTGHEYHGYSVITCDLLHVWYIDTLLRKCNAFIFRVEGAGSSFFQKVEIPSQKTVIQNLKLQWCIFDS
jgi:hypothetical protein